METPRPRVIGIIVVIVAFIALAQLLFFTHQQGQITQCQANVNQQFLTTIQQRAAISDGDREAIRTLIATIVAHPNDQAVAAQAITDYQTKNTQLDELRAKFQYPDLNKC